MKKYLATFMFLLLTAAPALALANDVEYLISIDGITCPFCVATSEKALMKIDGVKAVSSSLKEGTITVCADDKKVSFTDEQLTELFKKKGFTYRGMEKGGMCEA